MGRPPSPETLKIRNSVIHLLRRTTWRCGRLERSIVKFLMRRYPYEVTFSELLDYLLKTYGPTKGRLAHKIWDKSMELARKYGPMKGKLIYNLIKAIGRLESRHIIKVIPSHKKGRR